MTITRCEIRPGAYADSIVLMHLQSSLTELEGVDDAGVVMGTPANLELLAANGFEHADLTAAAPDDLVLVVRAVSESAALAALGRVDELLALRKSSGDTEGDFRPHGLRSAFSLLPSASVVTVSVPGRYAAGVAREALERGRHVFLYSDNVSIEEEVELKRRGREGGLLVMGPDCGTAILAGTGLGFSNRVRHGRIGLVGASGTGLQAVSCAIHALGGGVSHAIGTGGRDLKEEVGGVTALQALDLLARDDATDVIVLISKPPSPRVAERVLTAARASGKPVVVQLLGSAPPESSVEGLRFAGTFDETAGLAVSALEGGAAMDPSVAPPSIDRRNGDLRGLFAGGTVALEAQQRLAGLGLRSNLGGAGAASIDDLNRSSGHTILDLGEDEFTVGRLHPMMDQELRIRRLRQESADAATGLLLLDVVLGEGSHPDPASELAPEIAAITSSGEQDVVVLLVGTDLDPQGLDDQRERLEAAGARVFDRISLGLDWVAARLGVGPAEALPLELTLADGEVKESAGVAVDPASLANPLAAVNVGLESFRDSLVDQGAEVVQLDWRPPAGGDEKLMALLERLR